MRKKSRSKDARGNEVHQVVNATDGTLTSVTNPNGQTVNYTYDESKRVTGVETTADGKTYRNAYTYENDRIQYAYTEGALGSAVSTRTFSYASDWKDQLIANGSYPLTYDAIGNLKTYAGWEYEWMAGRRLVKQTQNEKVVSYDYDHNGMRIRQIVSNKTSGYVYATYSYTYNGSKLVHMTVYNDELHFFYDNQGRAAKVRYNGVTYTYVHNLQGDVVGILDSAGNLVVEYKYNAWGTILSKAGSMAGTLGHRNPFRYRGYIYDEETWMYWLKSRYYYPELHRFISIDSALGKCGAIADHNVYAYAKNTPVMLADVGGNYPYSASKALEYAEKWYNGRNPEFSYDKMGSDCANFVSQCLYAGGMPGSMKWFYWRVNILFLGTIKIKIMPAWGKADGLFNYLKDDMKFDYVKVTNQDELSAAITAGKVKPGSPAFFEKESVHHAVLVGSITSDNQDAFFYAHTTDRSPTDNAKSFSSVLENESIYIFTIPEEIK